MRLVSHLSRAIRRLGLTNTQFADQAGVARSTVQKLIGQDFKELRVDTIERLVARLKVSDLNELFSLQDDSEEFLAPFESSKSVTFLFGTHDVTDTSSFGRIEHPETAGRTTIDMWDFRAQTEFLRHIRRHVPDIRDDLEFYSKESFGEEERNRVLELVERQNTVIVGSPKVNPACEVVLRELYPGCRRDPTLLDKGPPLRLADGGRLSGSVLGIGKPRRFGVYDVRTRRMVAKSRYQGVGRKSLDGGILLSVFRPRRTNENVQLVIAAGISGCATFGVMRGLVDHPPGKDELEPGKPWMRAFQTRYIKPTDAVRDDREVIDVTPVSD